ncbi:phosphoglycerate dehydrogenase-like enzyme [Brevibacterium sanguinis]|uniref:Phosphoglycerate dehydrogenase-like enzyme n=2 Tax=Brevibacterium TaxID=1696 RepID=A0A366INE5_9MICO|nr:MULTISPECIES: 2-hydroxyacid dehydrogenase [Brevibacterium]RBP67989.1 phosphoglycerate dehydrogenase-like enzyme [Brevibacterium sanguinis]RBP74594.1 phosphoglycerate dehydrogenase-like enzyme [Brevibacterium celere]
MSIKTIAFPNSELRNRVIARIPAHQRANVDLVVYSAEEKSAKVSRDDIDVLILPYLDSAPTIALLDDLPNLRLVVTQTTGYDPVAHLPERGIAVATASGVHTGGTAELAVALTLASLRGIDDAVRHQVARIWDHRRHRSLQDRRVMIIGVGEIGAAIADRFAPFDVKLTRVATTAREDDRGPVHGVDELPRLLPHTEVVVLITPLTDSTHHLVDREFLSLLPDNALIVNVARGKVIDTDALVAELSTGRLHAALDVVDPEPLPVDHPLWGTPNTLITPHVGGDTSAFEPRVVQVLAEQVRRINDGEKPLNLVRID